MDRPFSPNLAAFLDHTLDAVMAADDSRRWVHMNSAAETLLGVPKADIRRYTVADLVLPPPGMTIDELWHQFIAEQKFAGRLAIRRPDGEQRDVEVSATANWRPGLHVGFCRDITERVQAERRLTTQLEVARAITESASIADAAPRLLGALAFNLAASAGALWVLDRQADVLRCAGVWAGTNGSGWLPADSPAALRRGEGIPGLVWQSGKPLYLDDLAAAPESPRRRDALTAGLRSACAFPIPGGFGIIGVAEFYGRAITAPDAEHLEVLTEACAQLSQFFERRRAESQLLLTGKLGWYMPLPLAVWRLVHDGDAPELRLVATNPALRRHTGADWPIGSRMEDVAPDATTFDIPRLLADVVRSGEPADLPEMPSTVKPGSIVALRAIPLPDECVGVIVEDVTERRRLQQHLLSYTSNLEAEVSARIAQLSRLEAERAREEKLAATGRLAARVAHEIINPLASIKNAFALVKGGVRPDFEHAHYLPRIEREIDRIARIVAQMRELYRPVTEPVIACDVVAVAQDVVALNETEARRRGVTVRLAAPPEGLVAAIQHGGVSQILHNLLRNALDASPDGGEVRVAVLNGSGALRLTVSDDGPGVPDEVVDHLFEPFFTTKGARDGTAGLGLGLSIAQSLAEAMRGRIVLTREPDRGATFSLILPNSATPPA